MKKLLIFAVVLLSIFIAGCDGDKAIKEDASLIDPTVAEQNIALIVEGGFTPEEAIPINDILQSIGLQNITKFEGSPKYMEEYGYIVSAEQLGLAVMPVYFNLEDRTVKKIVYKNVVLYENGELKDTIASGTITDREKSRAIDAAENLIRQQMKDPSSAKFPGQYWVSKENSVVRVKGYVDSKNSFGVMVRSDFAVEFDSKITPISYTLTSR